MESNFFSWLDSFGLPVGTWLGIIIGGFAVIGGIIAAFIKTKKSYDDKIREKTITEQADKDFHKSMDELVEKVSKIQEEVITISENQKKQNSDVTEKLDEMWVAINDSKETSTSNDTLLGDRMQSYESTMATINNKLTLMDQKTTLLIESDKEGIKAYIVDKYYKALESGYINTHTLQIVEQRYEKYLQENGNTYIRSLMEKLRDLPNDPPNE